MAEVPAGETEVLTPAAAGASGQKRSPIHDFLPDGHIRLFEIDLKPGRTIAGKLQTAKIGGGATYFALSYVCGTGADERKISVDGEVFKCKANLYNALATLRSYFRAEKAPKALLWIDAICIDQSDEQEKARQIGNMHDVFSRAQEVLVCLGHVSDDVGLFLHVLAWDELYADLETKLSSESLRMLQDSVGMDQDDSSSRRVRARKWTTSRLAWLRNPSTLLDGFEQHRRSADMELWSNHEDAETAERIVSFLDITRRLVKHRRVAWRNLHAMHVFLEKLDTAAISHLFSAPVEELQSKLECVLDTPSVRDDLFRLDHKFWSALHAFIRHEWFQRVWTFQEILLAPKARFFAGDVRIDWRNVVRHTRGLLTAINAKNLREMIDPSAQRARAIEHPIETAAHVATWALYSQDEINVNLYYLMIVTSNRRATVVKDNVYALLALLDLEERTQITIDYSKPDAEVLTTAIKVAMHFTSWLGKENGGKDASIAHLWELHGLWDSSNQKQPPVDNLPSWCPELRGSVDLTPLTIGGTGMVVWEAFSRAFAKKSEPYLCYDHSASVDTLSLKVLRVDTIERCMNIVCPLSIHDFFHTSTARSEQKTYAKRARTHIQWLLDLQRTFPPKDADPGSLSRRLEIYLYDTKKKKNHFETIRSLDDFSAALTLMFSIIAETRKTTERDMLSIGEAFVILVEQRHRLLFETRAGRFGFSSRQPELGSQLVIAPGGFMFHMLSADSSRYIGCAIISGMMEDAMLGVLDERKHDWEMIHLK
jgi:hypothetical protein